MSNYLITEGEVFTGRSQTETMPYWLSNNEVNTARLRFEIFSETKCQRLTLFVIWLFAGLLISPQALRERTIPQNSPIRAHVISATNTSHINSNYLRIIGQLDKIKKITEDNVYIINNQIFQNPSNIFCQVKALCIQFFYLFSMYEQCSLFLVCQVDTECSSFCWL